MTKKQIIDETVAAYSNPANRGHDIEFWADLQSWHDTDDNFDSGGISGAGKEQLAELRSQYDEE